MDYFSINMMNFQILKTQRVSPRGIYSSNKILFFIRLSPSYDIFRNSIDIANILKGYIFIHLNLIFHESVPFMTQKMRTKVLQKQMKRQNKMNLSMQIILRNAEQRLLMKNQGKMDVSSPLRIWIMNKKRKSVLSLIMRTPQR